MNNQNGFSLIEVMTSSAITLIVVAAFASFTENSWKALSRQNSKASQLFLTQDLRTEMNNPALCKAGVTATSQQYSPSGGKLELKYKMSNGTELIKGQEPKGYEFNFDGLEFLPSGVTAPIASGGTAYLGEVVMNGSTSRGGKMAFAPMSLGSVFLLVNALGMIYDCSVAPPAPGGGGGGKCTDGPWVGTQSCNSTGPWTPPYNDGQTCTSVSAAGGRPLDGIPSMKITCTSVCKGGYWQSKGCTFS